jgi:hypothetical protein
MIPIKTAYTQAAMLYNHNIKERCKDFPIPFFDVKVVSYKQGTDSFLHFYKVDVKLPRFYYAAIPLSVVAEVYSFGWLYVVSLLLALMSYFWSDSFFWNVIRLGLRKSGVTGKIAYYTKKRALEEVVFRRDTKRFI